MLLQISCDYQDPSQDSINNVWLRGRRTHTRLRKPPKQFSTLPPRLHQPKACKRACNNINSLGLAESPKYKNSSSPAQSVSNSPSAIGKCFTFRVYSSVPLETGRDPLSPVTQAHSILPSIHLLRAKNTWVSWPRLAGQMGNRMFHVPSPFSLVPGASPLPWFTHWGVGERLLR